MTKKGKIAILLLVVVSTAVLFMGCSESEITPEEKTLLNVSTNFKQEPEKELDEFEVIYSKNDQKYTKKFPISQKEFVFEDLEAGDWNITVNAKDANGNCHYKGENTATVMAENTTTVNVELDLLDDPDTDSNLKLSFAFNQDVDSQIESFVINFFQNDKEYIKKVSADQSEFVFDDLTAGEWDVFVVAKVENGIPKYKGQTTATIKSDDNTVAEVNLNEQNTLDLKDGKYNDADDYDINTSWIGVGRKEKLLAVTGLNLNEIELQKINYNQTSKTNYIAFDSEEFKNEVIDFTYKESHADSSLVELRDKIVSKTKMNENSVIIGDRYHTKSLQLSMGIPKLSDNALNWLESTSIKAFKEAYGDMYINQVYLGAEFHVIYRATAEESLTEEEKNELKTKIKESKAHIFDENTTSLTSGFSDSELEKYEIAIKIYSFGKMMKFRPGDNAQEIRTAFNQFHENIEAGKNLGVLDYGLTDYPIYHTH